MKTLKELTDELKEWSERLIIVSKVTNYTPKEKLKILKLTQNRIRIIQNDIDAIKHPPQ